MNLAFAPLPAAVVRRSLAKHPRGRCSSRISSAMLIGRAQSICVAKAQLVWLSGNA
jgi:hypothetical protein